MEKKIDIVKKDNPVFFKSEDVFDSVDTIELRFPYMMNFKDAYRWLKDKAEMFKNMNGFSGKITARFNDTLLNSDMTEDEMYIAHCGKPKEEALAEEKRIKEELERHCKEIEAKEKAMKEEHEKWVIENYGTQENYDRVRVNSYMDKSKRIVPDYLSKDFKEMVQNNLNGSYHIDEVLYYLRVLKTSDNPEKQFDELKEYFEEQSHSGATGNWTLNNIEHFGGYYGKLFVNYMRGIK